jgi:hypothetical protein
MSEMELQLVLTLVGALFVTFMTWRMNRFLSAGRPMTPVSKKMLSHGFLFVLGSGLFIAWNDQLASLLHFPGREVWRPLSFAWAILLLYDAARRLPKRPSLAERMAESPAPDDCAGRSVQTKQSLQAYVTTGTAVFIVLRNTRSNCRASARGHRGRCRDCGGTVVI